MLDIRLIRDEPELVAESFARRGEQHDIAGVLALDVRRRELVGQVEDLRAQRNAASKQIGAAKQRGEDAATEMEAVRVLGDEQATLEATLTEVDDALRDALVALPNIVQPDVPAGGEDAFEVLREVGSVPDFNFAVRDHLDLGVALGMIDSERGARTSGSRFAYLLGDAVRLQFALVQFALGRLTAAGFTPVVPPVLVREEAMWGTGFFPTDKHQIYQTVDDLFLVGTSEVPLAALHMDEILLPENLPLRYAGVSPCFRREAGAAGKDTRGIIRVHQFDKVEMFSFVEPSASVDEQEFLLAQEEALFQALELPYRIVKVAAGDLGSPASKKYDLEVWLPSQQRYLELTSCSNCTDYQARRLNARVRRDKGTEFVHTLNGTAFAIARAIVVLLENGQQEDGSVVIPQALVPFGAPERIAPA